MRICFLTCLNARPRVSRIAIECFARLKESFPVSMIAAYSDDVDLPVLQEAQDRLLHVDFIKTANKPIGGKWNAVLEYAYRSSQDFTHFLIMGDDDSLSDAGMAFLTEDDYGYFHARDYAGFNRNAYYELHDGTAMIHQYKCANKLIGAARMISRHAIEQTCVRQPCIMRKEYFRYKVGDKVNYRLDVAEYLEGYGHAKRSGDPVFEGLWPTTHKHGMDHWSELKLVHNGFIPYAIQSDQIHITDFKTDKNMWPYSILENKCTATDPANATWFLNDREREIINSFK